MSFDYLDIFEADIIGYTYNGKLLISNLPLSNV